jgi:hypothetical protein
MRTILRAYPDGETIALFPDEPADDEGNCCMAFIGAGQFFPVQLDVVMKNTKPADLNGGETKRMTRKLEKHRRLPKFERKPEVIGTKINAGNRKKLEGEDFKQRLKENRWMMR